MLGQEKYKLLLEWHEMRIWKAVSIWGGVCVCVCVCVCEYDADTVEWTEGALLRQEAWKMF